MNILVQIFCLLYDKELKYLDYNALVDYLLLDFALSNLIKNSGNIPIGSIIDLHFFAMIMAGLAGRPA